MAPKLLENQFRSSINNKRFSSATFNYTWNPDKRPLSININSYNTTNNCYMKYTVTPSLINSQYCTASSDLRYSVKDKELQV